jgi:rhodanese-related sulfurtransferase
MKYIVSILSLILFTGMASAASTEDISIEDLEKHIEAGTVTLIDVNGTKSYKKGHIPGAIDFASQKDMLSMHLPKDKDALIVAYCGSPKCGAYKRGVQAAQQLGYTNIKHLSAGISGWKAAEKTVETE